jgi:hypothetical protein
MPIATHASPVSAQFRAASAFSSNTTLAVALLVQAPTDCTVGTVFPHPPVRVSGFNNYIC